MGEGDGGDTYEIPEPLLWDKFLTHIRMTDVAVLDRQPDYWVFERFMLFKIQIEFGLIPFWPQVF